MADVWRGGRAAWWNWEHGAGMPRESAGKDACPTPAVLVRADTAAAGDGRRPERDSIAANRALSRGPVRASAGQATHTAMDTLRFLQLIILVTACLPLAARAQTNAPAAPLAGQIASARRQLEARFDTNRPAYVAQMVRPEPSRHDGTNSDRTWPTCPPPGDRLERGRSEMPVTTARAGGPGRRGSPGCCWHCPERSGCDSPPGSSPPGCSNCRRAPRGQTPFFWPHPVASASTRWRKIFACARLVNATNAVTRS